MADTLTIGEWTLELDETGNLYFEDWYAIQYLYHSDPKAQELARTALSAWTKHHDDRAFRPLLQYCAHLEA